MEKHKTWGDPVRVMDDWDNAVERERRKHKNSDWDRATQWEREVFQFDRKGRRIRTHKRKADLEFWENFLIMIFVMCAMTACFVAGLWVGKYIWGGAF